MESESKYFSCENCDSTFVTKRSLDSHNKAFHHSQFFKDKARSTRKLKERVSSIENKNLIIQLNSSANTTTTTTTNTIEKYSCKLCNRKFQNRIYLLEHVNTVHSEVTITRTRPEQIQNVRQGQSPQKARISLLKRPLVENDIEDLVVQKRLAAIPPMELVVDKNVKNEEDPVSSEVDNFEITEVVRNLLISHMAAAAEREGIIEKVEIPKSISCYVNRSLSIESRVSSSIQSQIDDDGSESDEDEFEGEGEGNDGDYLDESNGDPLFVPEVTFEQSDGEINGNFPCSECGALFLTSFKLERHLEHHNSNRPYKCSICGDSRGFVRKEHLTKHMSSVHSGMKFTCEFCGKDISRRDHLVRHIRTVHRCAVPPNLDMMIASNSQIAQNDPLAQLELEISDKTFQSMQPKPKKPYTKCDMCDETFTQLEGLFQHQRDAHSDIRKYNCESCPKSFKRREHLQKHLVLHTGEKKFSCEYCAKSFPRRDALQDHLRRIHGTTNPVDTEFPCSLCDKVFLQRPNLVRHRNSVHNISIAVAIANTTSTGQFFGNSELTCSVLPTSRKFRTKKIQRPPIPGLLPIGNFFQTSIRNN